MNEKTAPGDVAMPVAGWRKEFESHTAFAAYTGFATGEATNLGWRALVKQADAQAALAALTAERDALASKVSELSAARFAYAGEFPSDDAGDRDVGSIHQNIRELKAERDALRNILLEIKEHGLSWDDRYDAAMTKEPK